MNVEKDSKLWQSRAIEVLKFPLACMIVAIHCYYFNTQHINRSIGWRSGIVKSIIDLCSIILTDAAVPMFFIISGYLYFYKIGGHISKIEYLRTTKRKLITLMLPYIAWNILAIFANPTQFFNVPLMGKLLGFWSTNCTFASWAGPWDGPLWFLRDLFVVMLFSPFIAWVINELGMIIPFALLIIVYYLRIDALYPGFSISSISWFSCGAYLSISKPNFSKIFDDNKVISVMIVLFIILLCLRFVTISYDELFATMIKRTLLFFWVLISIGVYFLFALKVQASLNNIKIWQKLGASSFVVFAMHSLINGKISSVCIYVIGKDNMNSLVTLLVYMSTICVTVLICYCFHLLICKNKILSLLFEGGRKR